MPLNVDNPREGAQPAGGGSRPTSPKPARSTPETPNGPWQGPFVCLCTVRHPCQPLGWVRNQV